MWSDCFSSHFCRLESVPIMTVNGGTLPLDLLGTRSMRTKSKTVEDSWRPTASCISMSRTITAFRIHRYFFLMLDMCSKWKGASISCELVMPIFFISASDLRGNRALLPEALRALKWPRNGSCKLREIRVCSPAHALQSQSHGLWQVLDSSHGSEQGDHGAKTFKTMAQHADNSEKQIDDDWSSRDSLLVLVYPRMVMLLELTHWCYQS